MASLSQPDAIHDAVSQLDSSGVTFSIEFVGSVSVKISLNSEKSDRRDSIGEACITLVASRAHKIKDAQEIMNVGDVLGDLAIIKTEVDLNVTHKSLLIIDSNGNLPRVLHRLEIQDISLVFPGQNNMDEYFCFFAKCMNQNIEERKCFVFYAGKEKADVCRLLYIAFETAGRRRCSHSKSLTPSTGISAREGPSSSFGPAHSHRRERDPRNNDTHSSEINEKENFRNLTQNLEREFWYHGLMNREMAETKVVRDNQFLVRKSQNKPNQVILTGMQGSQVKHICLIDATGKLRTTEREFKSVSELIRYYQTSMMPLSGDHQSELILGEPVRRTFF
ncbi:unnamed protein product [Bursaphelenchus xylophilus]|uniref:(pine wood nematode) hypothetical protein n=1 Tax=Bursaphelenchus xylophilus TaxID=6326 RepID=A0A1I7SDR4_BURXY|nr:unnamed protein product [Bursaphelenchus xylophilus]CAG9084391.1 unnamed protein product [Bursaphelenchus xylophilus]